MSVGQSVAYNPVGRVVYDPAYYPFGGGVGINDGVLFQNDVFAQFQNGNIADFQGYQQVVPPVTCTTGWIDNEAEYAALGWPTPGNGFATGTTNGKSWTWIHGTDAAIPFVRLAQSGAAPDSLSLLNQKFAVEIKLNFEPQTLGTGDFSVSSLSVGNVGISLWRSKISPTSTSYLQMEVWVGPNDGVQFSFEGDDPSKCTLLSIRSNDGGYSPDSKLYFTMVYDGQEYENEYVGDTIEWGPPNYAKSSTNTNYLEGNVSVDLHSAYEQWELDYPADTQDLCGNTKP